VSVLVVGLNHRSAPVALLERVAVGPDDLAKALHELVSGADVNEAVVLSTCNRVEVYADVERFHGGVAAISDVVSRTSGVPLEDLTDSLYVHYEDQAVAHLFSVSSGLDSMVVGEAQILGQLRAAYGRARDEGAAARVLHELFQQALRVGKRAHSETGIDRAGASVVSVGLALGEQALGTLAGKRVLVVGAGSMGALAGATLRRAGVGDVVVANRTLDRAERLAVTLAGRAVGLEGLEEEVRAADLVVSSTGATGIVVPADLVERAVAGRGERPLFLLDLALPHDVDPAVRRLSGVTLTDLETLRGVLAGSETADDVDAARRIVADEVGSFLSWQRSVRVAPTVVALRSQAAEVVAAELLRLEGRLPHLSAADREEVAVTVRRVVDKLLHTPTVRVKELAAAPGGEGYALALRELFGLDRAAPAAVTQVALEPALDAPGIPLGALPLGEQP
jgi:glutamyl-tRNA reductase